MKASTNLASRQISDHNLNLHTVLLLHTVRHALQFLLAASSDDNYFDQSQAM